MPGDKWQRFANIRSLYAYMFAQAGKKLLFMGDEIAQPGEWHHDSSIDWHVLKDPQHAGVLALVRVLNEIYKSEPCMHELDHSVEGFEWVDMHDAQQSVYSFLRKEKGPGRVLAVFNMTPVPRPGYRVGVPAAGDWEVVLNTDDKAFAGSGSGSNGLIKADQNGSHGRPASLTLDLPPLGAVFVKGSAS